MVGEKKLQDGEETLTIKVERGVGKAIVNLQVTIPNTKRKEKILRRGREAILWSVRA